MHVAVIQHELDHLLGLNHVEDPSQLMYKNAIDTSAYGVGDLPGLAHLGAGDCIPDLWIWKAKRMAQATKRVREAVGL